MLSTTRKFAIAIAAVAALSTVGATAQAKTNHPPSRHSYASLANYTAGFMTKGNKVPQGGNRYEPGFAGWANFARGYKASHPEAFRG
jgi:hypothetical protein